MSAGTARCPDAAGPAASFGSRLAAACAAVAELVAAAAGQLDEAADGDVLTTMGDLTTLVCQADSVRVAVARVAGRRELYRRRGAGSVAGWLRQDPRLADQAAHLSRLAHGAERLPKVSATLAAGRASLAQAGTASWQVSQLPDLPQPGTDTDSPHTDSPVVEPAGMEPGGEEEELWAGLWRSGDVHAAADELFAGFLPQLDPAQLRILGAHLREAADAHDRAREDGTAYAKRALRITRLLGDTAAISGHLHPEAADLLLATFEQLGAKADPDDTRTKPQRWADALTYLASLITPVPAPASPGPTPAEPGPASAEPGPGPARPGPAPASPGPGSAGPAVGRHPSSWPPEADDEPSPDASHGHPCPGEPAGRSSAAPPGLRRPRVIVTVPLSSLLGRPLAPGAVLGTGTPITAEAARRYACDAGIIRLITHPPEPSGRLPDPPATRLGQNATAQLTTLLAHAIAQLPPPLAGPSAALDIGRQSQSWTPRQRDALHALHGGRCAKPGCTKPIDAIHHIIHWLFGGKTQIANGAPLCLHHHWLVHEGGWQISRRPDGSLLFTPPPPGWRPGTIYRRGKPLPDTAPDVSDR